MKKGVAALFVLIILAALCMANNSPVKAQYGNSWVEKAPMPTARFSFGIATVNGNIYSIGGAIATQSAELLAVNEEYNPTTNTWTSKTPMPTPRYGCAVTVYENKIYAFGGGIHGSVDDTNVTEVYDPATDTWVTKASMPTARNLLQANVVDGKIYLIGGNPNGTLNEVYDPATNSWTTKASIPTAVVAYASAVIDDKIYIIGGFTNLTQIYDPKIDQWSLGAPLPLSLSGAGAGAITCASGSKAIYVIGGETGVFSPQKLTQVYFPENDSWGMGASLPIVRSRLCVAVVNDTLYAIGGTRAAMHQGLTDNVQYMPYGYGTILSSSSPSPSFSPAHSPTPSPTSSPLASSSTSPSPTSMPSFTPNPTPTMHTSSSPTQQPTPEDSTATPIVDGFETVNSIIIIATVAIMVIVGLLAYLLRRKSNESIY